MGYVYAAGWVLIAVLLIVNYRDISKLVYLLSGYFFLMGIWWFADQLLEVDMMHGVYAWILRGISLAVVVILLISYYMRKKSPASASRQDSRTESMISDTAEAE